MSGLLCCYLCVYLGVVLRSSVVARLAFVTLLPGVMGATLIPRLALVAFLARRDAAQDGRNRR